MVQFLTAFEDECACRVVFPYVIHGFTEMVVNRGSSPNPHMAIPFLVEFIHSRLNDDAETFHQKDAAEQRQHQFLVDNHCANADDAADGEAAGVAEKHLRRETVPPQVAHQRPDERCKEDCDFFRTGNVHHVEILSKNNAAAHIGQRHQSDPDDNRVSRTHAVHAVVQVGTIAYCRHYEHRQQNKENPACAVFVRFPKPGKEVSIVEVVVFLRTEEWSAWILSPEFCPPPRCCSQCGCSQLRSSSPPD